MSLYAEVEDVADRWDGVIDSGNEARVSVLLEDAEAILRSRMPDLAARITAGTTLPEMLRIVLCRVVIRMLDNPKGFQGEHVGERGYYFGAGSPVLGQLGFTASDLGDIGVASAAATGSVATPLPSYRLPFGAAVDCR